VLGYTLGGHDWWRLEKYLEVVDLKAIDLKVVDVEAIDLKAIDLEAIDLKAVNLQAVNLRAVNLQAVQLEAVDQEACAMEAKTLFIGWLAIATIEYNKLGWELGDRLGVGDSRSWDDAVQAVCRTQGMLYSVSTLHHGMER